MANIAIPTDPGDLTLETLNRLVGDHIPEASFSDFRITESHQVGLGLASSAGRICIDVDYADGSPADLPTRIVLKVARADLADPLRPDPIAGAAGALYRNELNIYRHIDPARFLESPAFLGGTYDRDTNSLLMMIEDLRPRGVTFPHVNVPTSLARMQSLLDQLAILHARYWNSAELAASSSWMQSHIRGDIHDQFVSPHVLPPHISGELAAEQFKREMVERLGTDANGLFQQVHRLQRHQAFLPRTLCHGDTHIGNTYRLPDDSGGLYDWQLASQGYCVHDVSYLIATGLTIAERRQHERELLSFYLDRLRARGGNEAPSFDELWLEYCRAMVWGVYIGWLITPVINYGWEITVMAHLRTMTAYEDLETARLIGALD
ncbi:MAG: phosphotransferase [Novosphingobium sp.]